MPIPANSESLNTANLFPGAVPGTATQMRQDFQLQMQGGAVNSTSGPSISESDASNENQVSSPPSENIEVFRLNRTLFQFLRSKGLSMNEFTQFQTEIQGRNVDENGIIMPSSPASLENETVATGILRIANVSHSNNAGGKFSGEEFTTPLLGWKNIVQNSSSQKDASGEKLNSGFGAAGVDPEIVVNGDGSSTISLPRCFLEKSRAKWATSCIGHFVGGSFSFKYVKNQAMKLWMNQGLQDVFYSSKGYFTFKFATEGDMKKVLSLNSIQIGGKRLYLAPWTDGATFQRNVLPSISTWIRLVDVPHSYWSWDGLGSIAKAVGKPLNLDKQTALLNPMKYAGVLVDLKFGAPCPKSVWVPTINENDGTIVNMKVDIEYSAVPRSCKFCKAFGHSDAYCAKNPEVQTRGKEKVGSTNTSKKTTWQGVRTTFEKDDDLPTTTEEDIAKVKKNDTFVGCDADLPTATEAEIAKVNKKDDLVDSDVENVDILPTATEEDSAKPKKKDTKIDDKIDDLNHPVKPVETGDQDKEVETGDDVMTVEMVNESETRDTEGFATETIVIGLPANITINDENGTEEGEIITTPSMNKSAGQRKKRNRGGKTKAKNGPWADTQQASPPIMPSPSKKGRIVDEDGFTPVVSKKSQQTQQSKPSPSQRRIADKRSLRSQGYVTKTHSF